MLHLDEWKIFRLSGSDVRKFLHGLTTQEINNLSIQEARYGLFLTPQGKYIGDFFIYSRDKNLFLEIRKTQQDLLIKKLSLHRLRADVFWQEDQELSVYSSFFAPQNSACFCYADPRSAALGFRIYAKNSASDESSLAENLRKKYKQALIKNGIADGADDMISVEDFPLDFAMDKFAIDFKKGCYVGQEVTARSFYRAARKKLLLCVQGFEPLPEQNADLFNQVGEKSARMLSSAGEFGLIIFRGEAAQIPEKLYFIDADKNQQELAVTIPPIHQKPEF
jgi:hypothetical protein